MSENNPDYWVVIEITNPEGESHRRVLATWAGSYLYGSSWKISSGIEKEEEFEDRYEFLNTSGSLYICRKSYYGMSGYGSGIFQHHQEALEKEGYKMVVVEGYDPDKK